MKSEIQIRAEEAMKAFSVSARKPVVVEFAGVPKAGKTSTLNQVQTFLKRCGFRTEIVVERASVCPIRDKKHFNFNVWTACTTLAQILEKTQEPPHVDDPHILFLDRGLFDAICWLTMMERLARIRPEDRKIVEQFLRIDDWKKRISGVILMIASPEDSIYREHGLLPVEGARASIMNKEVLEQIKNTNLECQKKLEKDFYIFKVDTSDKKIKDNPKKTAEIVTEFILSVIEEQIKEEILTLPKEKIQKIFETSQFIREDKAASLVDMFIKSGEFSPRQIVEKNSDLIQAIPVVVISNATGKYLRLKRKEKDTENILHEKMVIWAGGHVRKEDATNGNPLTHCAVRELEEELRLNIEPSQLILRGAIYIGEGTCTARKHIAVFYEWKAKTDDVAVVLSSAEFFERRGTSQSGGFIEMNELVRDIETDKITEPWSSIIIREFIASGHNRSTLLF
jgi:predicted NUDIX family phosphoesterase